MTAMRTPFCTREKTPRTMKGVSVKSYTWSLTSPLTSALVSPLSQTRRMGLWLLVGFAVIWSAFGLTTRPAAAQDFQLFVPSIGTEGPGGVGTEPTECALNGEEAAVEQFMLNHPDQSRDNLICDPILAQVARARARDMALRDYFSHTNPDGDGPNIIARRAGYPLPDWYSGDQDANNIESIGAGYSTPGDAFQGWMNSSSHRVHVLGANGFYGDQDSYGIGYFFNEDAQYGHYWVFISAPTAD